MKKIVFIGGGSFAWTPKIISDMFLDEVTREHHFCLYDIDRAAVDLVGGFVNKLKEELKVPARITVTDNMAEAFEGADFFVVTISTGGLDAMAHDLAIPEDYSIYHTVGDTAGPGGWARCIRNFKVFADLAEKFNQYAPHATVLNYTNPMTTLTDVLCRLCKGPVVGLCHGVFENLALIKLHYNLPSEDDISITFGGFNHFFWTKALTVRGEDALADLNQKVKNLSLTEIQDPNFVDGMGYSSHHELATDVFRRTGLMPYVGDRHTCEFFPGIISDLEQMKRFRLVRTTVEQRWDYWRQRRAVLEDGIKDGIPERFKVRSRETAVDILRARLTGRPFIDVGNVPNRGQMPDLPEGAVVETLVLVNGVGFTPLVAGHFPPEIVAYLKPFGQVFTQTVDACFEGNREKALGALRLDPVCNHLPDAKVREMGERLLIAHQKFISF